MRRTSRRALLATFATVLVILPVASAQAAPQWYAGGKPLVGPMVVKVKDSLFLLFNEGRYEAGCKFSGSVTLTNPPSGAGTSEVTSLRLTSCARRQGPSPCPSRRLSITPTHLPWQGHLIVVSGIVRDEFERFDYDVKCTQSQEIRWETLSQEVCSTVGNGLLELRESAPCNSQLVQGNVRLKTPRRARITAQ
jgi:hypothetical protein